MLRIESPPSSKKLSWMPMDGSCSTSCQIDASRISRGVTAGACGWAVSTVSAGTGSALRLILPLGSIGRDSSVTNFDGTM
ncbi:hypothetical protein BamMEX5DRAFT_6790 [Burkholderia ambifaria MEX-5]|uniref:Uncharacterized protein n=1 Tax=Burkholderia ambifaria MEX-5 TaxID=396597 RepID=B1TG74_9BURK|nr:hypothetical protein BamMEX5DRAFT_6790 [Burkholderia ambifaria MEX-5]